MPIPRGGKRQQGEPASAIPEITVFRPGKPGLRKVLGDLEADIMEVVWRRAPGARTTVRDVVDAMQGTRDSAYTTVMTVMGILVKKGLLRSRKAGIAHQYEATCTETEFTEAVVDRVVRELLTDFAGPALAHFAQAVDTRSDPGAWAERIRAEREREDAQGPGGRGRSV